MPQRPQPRLGIETRRATSSAEALATARDFRPHLLVSDSNLGEEVDGAELAARMTADLPTLVTVFMTGFSDRIKALQAAGVAVLAKPFTAEDLVNTLSLHLGERLRKSGATEPDA